jgi:hypothetical protein
MASSAKPAPLTMPAGEIARMLNVTTERLRQLSREGAIPKAVRGVYPVVETTQGYIRFLKADERRNSQSQAESGLKKARQREVELRIAQKEGDVVDFDDAKAAFSQILGGFRAELNGIPAAVSRDRAVRAAVTKGINDALTRCEARFREASANLRAGRDPFGSDREDDA